MLLGLAVVATGCLGGSGDDPGTSPPLNAEMGKMGAAAPPAAEPFAFEGAFSGANANGEALTLQREGIHHLAIPDGQPSVRFELSWTGSAPFGISLKLLGGDGTLVWQGNVEEPELTLELEPGKWPSGDAHFILGPATNGPALQVEYSGTVSYAFA